jgi:hypothetical protein
VAFPVIGVVEEFGNPPAIVRTAHIDHTRTKSTKHSIAIIEELLRRPEVDLLGYAVGIDDGWPKFLDVRSPLVGMPSAGVAPVDLLECGLDVLPIAGLHRGEKPVNVLGDLNIVASGQRIGEPTACTGKFSKFPGDDFLGVELREGRVTSWMRLRVLGFNCARMGR